MANFLTVKPNFTKNDKIVRDIKTPSGKIYKAGTKVTSPKEINEALKMKLKVTGDVSVERNYKVTETQVYKNANNFSPFVFHNTGKGDYSFKVTVANKNNNINDYLDYCYVNAIPMNVVVDTHTIPNMLYRIVEASDRTVIRRNYTEWKLKFTSYTDIKVTEKSKTTAQANTNTLANQIKKCTLKKWTKKTYVINSKTGKKVKQDVNDCNKIVLKILYKKGFLKKKYIGTNWDQWYKRKITKKKKSNLKDTNGNAAVLVVKTNKTETVWPCKVALKKFQKAWNKKKLKPHLKENGKKDKNTLKALKRYKEL